jgi:hypothetical protein
VTFLQCCTVSISRDQSRSFGYRMVPKARYPHSHTDRSIFPSLPVKVLSASSVASTLSPARFSLLWRDLDLTKVGSEWIVQYIMTLCSAVLLSPDQAAAIIDNVLAHFGFNTCSRISKKVRSGQNERPYTRLTKYVTVCTLEHTMVCKYACYGLRKGGTCATCATLFCDFRICSLTRYGFPILTTGRYLFKGSL